MAAKKDGRPSRDQAEEAVRTLLLWAGEDPDREVSMMYFLLGRFTRGQTLHARPDPN